MEINLLILCSRFPLLLLTLGEVQFGDPFVDPYAILNESDFGTVTGTIVSESGDFVPEYDVWFFKASEDGEDIHAGEPVFSTLVRRKRNLHR